MTIGIAAFTDGGASLLGRITAALGDTFHVYDKAKERVKPWLGREFQECDAIVFVGAAGIAVRLIAGLLSAKDKDPAVVVLDEKGNFAVPILSGHIGGANALARRLAEAIGATPVITTATDVNGVFAVDVWSVEHGCVIDDAASIKAVSAALLREEPVGFCGDFAMDGPLPEGLRMAESGPVGVCISLDASHKPFGTTLNVLPKIVSLGVGCRKGTPPCDFEAFVRETLESRRVSLKAVKSLSSIDLKKDEECIQRFAGKYGIPFTTFSGEELNRAEGRFTPSEFVKATTGVDNVCERSAALKIQEGGGALMIINKTAKSGMTLAAAIPSWRVSF